MSNCNTNTCDCSPATETTTAQTTQTTRPTEIFHPQVDAHQAGEDLVIVADMPGASPESIDINFDHAILTIRGKVAPRTPQGLRDDAVLLNEYGVSDYYRSFRVGPPIDPAAITADYKDGVLTIRLPRHENARPRHIPVSAAK